MPQEITARARLLGLLGVALGAASCPAAYWFFSLSYEPGVTAAQVLSALGVLALLGAGAAAALAGWLVVVARASRPAPLLHVLQSAAGGRLLVVWLALVALPSLPHTVARPFDADLRVADAVVVAMGLAVVAVTGVIVHRVNRARSRV
jgi:hypothetical protein